MRRILFIAASILVSGFFLWLALRDVNIGEVVNNIRQADLGWLLISVVFTSAGLWTRGIRWRGLLGYKIPLGQAFHIWNISALVNQLPLRAGEIARSLLAMRAGVPLMTAATSIVVERLLDTLFVVMVLSFALSQSPLAPELATRSAAFFGIASIIVFIVLLFFARYPQLARQILGWFETRLPLFKRLPLRPLLDNVLEGLQPLTHWRGASHAIGWTVISWALSFGTFYTLHRALHIDGVNLLLSAAISVTLASFSIAIPVTVAGLGPFQLAVLVSGEAVTPPAVWAASMKTIYSGLGFLIHGMNVLNYAAWGTLGMVILGVSLSDVVQQPAEVEAKPAQI